MAFLTSGTNTSIKPSLPAINLAGIGLPPKLNTKAAGQAALNQIKSYAQPSQPSLINPNAKLNLSGTLNIPSNQPKSAITASSLPTSGSLDAFKISKMAQNSSSPTLSKPQTQAASNLKPVSAPASPTSLQKTIYRVGGDIYDAVTNKKLGYNEFMTGYSGKAKEVSAPSQTPAQPQAPTQASASFNPTQSQQLEQALARINAGQAQPATATNAGDAANVKYAQDRGWQSTAGTGFPSSTAGGATGAATGAGTAQSGTTNQPAATNPYMDKLTALYDKILAGITPSQEEIDAAKAVSDATASMNQGILNAEGQVIPMEFITGQQAQIQKQGALTTQTLQDKLINLQNQRQANLQAAQAGAGILGAQQDIQTAGTTFTNTLAQGGYKPYQKGIMLNPGEKVVTLQNPATGQSQEYVQPAQADNIGTISAGSTLYDKRTGEIIGTAPSTGASGKYVNVNGIDYWQDEAGNLSKPMTPAQTPEASAYQAERAFRTIQGVDNLIDRVNGWTVGYGKWLANIPSTDAADFEADLNTLKSSIAFGELTAMREASKTGGALGQVSDREGKLLESALGALDTKQSPENFRKNLEQIKASIQRWQEATNQASTVGEDEDFSW